METRLPAPASNAAMETQANCTVHGPTASVGTEANDTKVLILGGGFGGIYAALELERVLKRQATVQVTLVSRDNFFLFTPMLHEIAASDLEMNAIVNPLRKMLKRAKTFVGNVENIDPVKQRVTVSHGFDGHRHDLIYDHLVLALGCGTNFFDLPGVEAAALTFKTLDDAVALRNRLILQIEEASSECAAEQRHPLLTFVVAGGGFAGVEIIGAINDFVRGSLRFYPSLRAENLRMLLVTPDELILPELGPKLGSYAQRKLIERGIEIVTHARVKAVHDGVVELTNGSTIEANTLIWTAGTAPSPLIANLPLPKERGRIKVDEYFQVPGWPGVWAVGDCAIIPDTRTGGFHPPTAQHAIREGKAAARNLAADIMGDRKRPFRFSALGLLAAIGRRTGVAHIFGVNFSGFFAWWLWRTVYLSKLPRLEKKVRVALDWTLDLCFSKDFACFSASIAHLGAEKSGAGVGADSVQAVKAPLQPTIAAAGGR